MGAMSELDIMIQSKCDDDVDRYHELVAEINAHIQGDRLLDTLSQEAQEILAEWEDRQTNTVLSSMIRRIAVGSKI